MEKKGTDRIFTYHHPILKFSADFVLSSKSAIPHLERLNPRYYDVNFRVEFNILLPTYSVEIILDIAEEIAHMFKFCVYNESYEDVTPFRKSMLAKTFELWKGAYKKQKRRWSRYVQSDRFGQFGANLQLYFAKSQIGSFIGTG